MPNPAQCILDHIQPIVLVGGQSSRFGRDKLIEQVNGKPMVAIPINTLRAVFGNCVAIVGQCDPQIAAMADAVIDDPYPGLGPVGGIYAALEHANSDIFVCAGDLISIDETTIRTIITASIQEPKALAYIAFDARRHPTVGLYRAGCLPIFQQSIAKGKLKLGMVLDQDSIRQVPVESSALRNINRPDELNQSDQ